MSNLFATPWHHGRFHAYDTETSGVSVDYDRIVTATFVTINGRDVERHQWLIACPIDIPEAAQAVHGISTEQSRRDGRPPADVIREIAGMMTDAALAGEPVVAYNGSYDFTITTRECARYGFGFAQPYVIDPLVIDKAVDKWRKGKRTLTAVCEHYGVRLDGAHDATEDALAAARVAWALAERYPDVVQIDPRELHEQQVAWKREQAESFGAYLARQGKPDDVARDWPIIPQPADWDPQQPPAHGESGAA